MTDDSKNKPTRTTDGSILKGSSKTTQSAQTGAVKGRPPPKSTK